MKTVTTIMCVGGSHPLHSCIICLVLLSNCIHLWASPARFADWPRLKIFGSDTRATLSREIRRPATPVPMSSSPSSSSSTQSSSSSKRQPSNSLTSSSPFLPSSTSTSSSSSPSSSSSSHLSSQSFAGCSGCRLQNQIRTDVGDHAAWSPVMSAAEKEYRVQALKRHILDALDLSEPPLIKGNPPEINPDIVEKVFGESEKVRDDDDNGYFDDYDDLQNDKQFILGVAGEARNYGNEHKAKLSFTIPPDVRRASFVKAKLWINLRNSSSASRRSLVVTQKLRGKHYSTKVVGAYRLEDDASGKWIDIELSSAALTLSSESMLVLEVITEATQQAVNVSASPILEAKFLTRDEARRHRVKRGVNCQSSNPTTCCLQTFSVTIEELGWRFILMPTSLEINYCRGSCDSGTNHIYNHSSVMYTRSMSETNARLRAQMLPCCTPKRLGPVQLLYYRSGSTLETKHIPNFKVLECGCA